MVSLPRVGTKAMAGVDSPSPRGLCVPMAWIIGIGVVLAVGIGIFYALGGKNYVCIRRKDCCGAGCGCLFPKKKKD